MPSSYVLPPSWAAADSAAPPDPDPSSASSMLASAGYCVLPVCVIAPSLRARIVVQGGSPPRIEAATLAANDLHAIGVVTSVSVYDDRGFATVVATGDFDLAVAARGGADPGDVTEEYISTSPRNITGYADPAFDTLQNDLLQGEITDDAVRKAYKRYLDEYTEVSRLAIAGGYVYTPDDVPEGTRRLVVFARTAGGNLVALWQQSPGSQFWNGPVQLGTSLVTSDPSAVALRAASSLVLRASSSNWSTRASR